MRKILNFILNHLNRFLSFFFTFPKSWGEEKIRKSYLTSIIYLFFLVFLIIVFLIRISFIIYFADYHNAESALSLLVFAGFFLFFLFFIKRRGGKLPALFLIFSLLFLSLSGSYRWGIDLFTVDIIYPLIVFLAAVLLNSRFAFFILTLIIISLSSFFYLQSNNLIEYNSSWKDFDTTILDLILISAVYFLMTAFSWLSTKEIEKSLKKANLEKEKNKDLAEELKYHNQNLEKIVQERTQDLKDFQLEQLISISPFVDLGKIAAGLIHDIRTPLSVVSLSLDTLSRSRTKIAEDKYQLVLNKAKNAVDSIDQFSDTSKNQFSRNKEKNYFNLNHEVKKIVRLFERKAKAKNLKIIFEPRKEYMLEAYKEKLNQVVANILLNAIESYPEKQKKENYIFIKIEKNKHYLLINIKDYGQGIKKENIDKVFLPRFTTKGKDKGLGLGLYFSQEIMTNFYESKVKVKSKEKEGSTFTLRIKNKFVVKDAEPKD